MVKEAIRTANLSKKYGTKNVVNNLNLSIKPGEIVGFLGLNGAGKTTIFHSMLKFLEYQGNFRYCLGIIGSGNRNFNKQFCLTAFQYADQFCFPVIDVFELRGTDEDVERISKHILASFEKAEEKIDVSY